LQRNLYLTELRIYDSPDLEIVTFQTEFGKFGLMTCYDALFAQPFLDLVEAEGAGISFHSLLHCTENPISLFPKMKLCGLVPYSYIHVSASNLYIPRIGLPMYLAVDPGYI
jgi:hypothetical protein